MTRNLVRIINEIVENEGGGLKLLSLRNSTDRAFIEDLQKKNKNFVFEEFNGSKIRLFISIMRSMAKYHYDYIMFDHINWARVGYIAKLLFNARYIIFLHYIELLNLNFFKKLALKNAEYLLSNSYYTKSQIQKLYSGLPVIKETLLGKDFDFLSHSHKKKTFACTRISAPYFMIVARMPKSGRNKGHELLIESMSILKNRGEKVSLVVVGDGNDKDRLVNLCMEKELHEEIIFTGFVSDDCLTALYDNCIALAMPSTGEGFGLVYIEAMARKKACIGCYGNGAEEIIVDNETGFLVRPDDAFMLADKMLRLLKVKHLASQFGECGYRRFKNHYTYDSFKKRVVNALS